MSNETGGGVPVCRVGLPFKFPAGYQPSQFLYGANGPWPSQPTDGSACTIAPEVLGQDGQQPNRIPESEEDDWTKNLGDWFSSNFPTFTNSAITDAAKVLGITVSTLDKFAIAGILGLWMTTKTRPTDGPNDQKGMYPQLSDAAFTDLMAHGLLSKLLSALDPPDEALFADLLNDTEREYWKSDLTHMVAVRTPWPGEYVAPTIVLVSCPRNPKPGQEYDFQVHAIALYAQSQPGGPYDQKGMLRPGDGKAWQLAKYFALQGALVRINLIDHPMVHFPYDAINAITKAILPTSNRVLQLLLPHLFLGLPVDNAVLEGPSSLLNRMSDYPYSPYPASGGDIRKVFPYYWHGSPTDAESAESWAANRANAFPPYSFRTVPRDLPSRYGTFLNTYYQPILRFTSAVVATIPADGKDWEEICRWADNVASWIPGFPKGSEINQNSELLAKTCASIMWNGAIVHSADHWLMHELIRNNLPAPYILRDQPLLSATPNVEPDFRPYAYLIDDVIPVRLCDLLFFRPHNTTLLIEDNYNFSPALVDKFRKDLRATEAALKQQFPEFAIQLDSTDPTVRVKDCFASGMQY